MPHSMPYWTSFRKCETEEIKWMAFKINGFALALLPSFQIKSQIWPEGIQGFKFNALLYCLFFFFSFPHRPLTARSEHNNNLKAPCKKRGKHEWVAHA